MISPLDLEEIARRILEAGRRGEADGEEHEADVHGLVSEIKRLNDELFKARCASSDARHAMERMLEYINLTDDDDEEEDEDGNPVPPSDEEMERREGLLDQAVDLAVAALARDTESQSYERFVKFTSAVELIAKGGKNREHYVELARAALDLSARDPGARYFAAKDLAAATSEFSVGEPAGQVEPDSEPSAPTEPERPSVPSVES
jgi:hypothetical protein